jgi:glycosyltransferase involved in cell wall biosynthesis
MRILIDCSNANLWGQPTGISRVARQYLEEGYRWAQIRGIEVIPVLPIAPEAVVIYEAPGLSQPAYLRELIGTSSLRSGLDTVGSISYARGHEARVWLRRLLRNCATTFKNTRLADYLYGLDNALSKLARTIVTAAIGIRKQSPRITLRNGDILFCPAYWHDVSPEIYRWIRSRGCDVVILLHDILPITMPNYYSHPARDHFRDNTIQALEIATAFTCVSKTTCKALSEFAQSRGKQGKFVTAYNGYYALQRKGDWSRAKDYSFQKQPLLMVGSIEPKKGHLKVIEAIEPKWDIGYDRPLMIIGRTAWMAAEITDRIRNSKYFGRKLFWFTDFDDSDLNEAYSRCHALIFASLAEGFGLPMLEASMHRKPTIAYRTMIAEEILGEFGFYFDDTPGSLSSAIDKFEDPEFYNRFCATLSNYKWPDWQDRVTALFDSFVNHAGRWNDLPSVI